MAIKNEIESYLHCRLCVASVPQGMSAQEWARLSIGIRSDGRTQVWCNRHNRNVMILPTKLAVPECEHPDHNEAPAADSFFGG